MYHVFNNKKKHKME